jgi:MFS transporter, FHS family, L-fucose permease
MFIFSGVEHDPASLAAMSRAQVDAYRVAEAHMVQIPYLILAVVVLVVAVAIRFVPLPAVRRISRDSHDRLADVMRTPGLAAAVIAQFFYVGAQVGIWSFFVDFVKDNLPGVPERTAAYLLSGSLVLFMTGRFAGAALMQHIPARRLLLVFASINIALCTIAAFSTGLPAVAAFGVTSVFMSIMFPTIFALGVRNLGPQASIGSSLIIMSIIGGAVFPPAMGFVASISGSLHLAMLLPMACFGVVALFAHSTRENSTSFSNQGHSSET